MSKKIVIAALGAVVAMGLTSQSYADADKLKSKIVDTKMQKMMKGMEKCYGIAKAGKSDCGSTTLSCGGESTVDGDKHAWIYVPKGTCDKIVGGSTKEGS